MILFHVRTENDIHVHVFVDVRTAEESSSGVWIILNSSPAKFYIYIQSIHFYVFKLNLCRNFMSMYFNLLVIPHERVCQLLCPYACILCIVM